MNLLFIFCNCNSEKIKERPNKSKVKIDNVEELVKNPIKTNRSNPIISREIRNQIDSLREVNAFKYSINLAKQKEKLFITSDTLEISVFKNIDKYAFIRFQSSFQRTKIGLYKIDKNQIDTILEKKYTEGYSTDTIRDVNGDNYLDVLTSFYSPSGCCLRDLVTVRLYNPKSKRFEDGIELMNPTFIEEENLILGLMYGHSGETPMYKGRWKELKYETIEYIYPEKKSNERYILVNAKSNLSKKIAMTNQNNYISALPEEYMKLEAIDWFLHYQKKEEKKSDH